MGNEKTTLYYSKTSTARLSLSVKVNLFVSIFTFANVSTKYFSSHFRIEFRWDALLMGKFLGCFKRRDFAMNKLNCLRTVR